MAAPRRKQPSRREGIHEDLMREWLGCDKPTNLRSNITEAGSLIDEILKKQFFADSLNEEEVKSVWKKVAGDFIGANTEPISVKEGHLVLRVTQPAMRFHLEQVRPDLLKSIQAHFGKQKVRSIRFSLG